MTEYGEVLEPDQPAHERRGCPECGSWQTEQTEVDWSEDTVRETRKCQDCRVQYAIEFRDPHVVKVKFPKEAPA